MRADQTLEGRIEKMLIYKTTWYKGWVRDNGKSNRVCLREITKKRKLEIMNQDGPKVGKGVTGVHGTTRGTRGAESRQDDQASALEFGTDTELVRPPESHASEPFLTFLIQPIILLQLPLPNSF